MTDKEKIRAEIERRIALYSGLSEETVNPNRIDEDRQILSFIDSMQEEPVSEIDFEQELYKYFGQVKDFTLGMRIAKRFYEIGRNYQETVSEDLEKAIDTYLATYFGGEKEKQDWPYLKKMAIHFANWQKQKNESKVLTEKQCRKIRDDAFELGKDAMKQQFEKNRLKHCNSITNEQAELESDFIDQHLDKYIRMPTYLDAIEYGMKLQKEQMVAKAANIEVKEDAGGYPYIPQIELYDYVEDIPLAKEGDKYNVVLIKED